MPEDNMETHGIILERMNGFENLLNQRFSAQHEIMQSLHRKVDLTNGRVTKQERWQAYIMGAVAILTTLILPILFIIAAKIINGL
jgi:hypothetical protein